MKVTFEGAAETVTGSKFLIEEGNTKVLVDCGLFQGLKTLRLRNWEPTSFDPRTLDAVVLTHAHIDHSGYLPVLYKNGFQGPVYCTAATRDLCRILLPDSGRIQEEDTSRANLKGYSKHKPALPLFTEADSLHAIELFKTQPLNQIFQIGELKFELYGAGHILGAASVLVKSPSTSALISGDLGRQHDVIMKAPLPPPHADWVIMESTYGDRNHPSEDPLDSLAQVVHESVKRGGILLIPTFAVGRAQAILHALYVLKKRQLIPNVPVYMDSPMATDATEIFLQHHQEHRLSQEETQEVCRSARYITSPKESFALNTAQRPAIILSASGMITGGRILHHVASMGSDPRNTILLVGYQAPGTRGAHLLEGQRSLKIHGSYVNISAQVKSINSFSAHADQSELLNWLGQANHNAKGVILVHGEPSAMDGLRLKIEEKFNLPVYLPHAQQTLTLK